MIGDDLIAYTDIFTPKICSDLCNLDIACVSFVYSGTNCALKNEVISEAASPVDDGSSNYYEKIVNQTTNLYSFNLKNPQFIGNITFFIYFEVEGGSFFLSQELTLVTICNMAPPDILLPNEE